MLHDIKKRLQILLKFKWKRIQIMNNNTFIKTTLFNTNILKIMYLPLISSQKTINIILQVSFN